MGIVVSFTMLLLLSVLRPSPWNGRVQDQSSTLFFSATILAALIFGGWNAFYGLGHLGEFWGFAALLSGVLILLSGLVLVIERSQGALIASLPRIALVAALAACFVLYTVTIVQLNLSLPYLGQ